MRNHFLSAIIATIVSFSMLFVTTPRVAQNQAEKNLGDATLTLAGTVYNLAGSGVSAAATSLTLTSLTIPQTGYKIQDADLSSTFYVTLEPGSRTRQEITSCTTITQNANNTATLSGCVRGLLPFSPYTTSSTYQFAHGGGTSVVFSNAPQLYEEFAARGNAETITGQWTFSSSSLPKASSDTSTSTVGASGFNFATVNYVGDVAVTGCSNGSETIRGCVEIATTAEVASGTTVGSTGATLVPPASIFSSTTAALTLVPVTQSTGKLKQAWLDLTELFSFSAISSASTTLTGRMTLTGSSTFLGDAAFSRNITVPATPVASTDATSKGYVDNLTGFSWVNGASSVSASTSQLLITLNHPASSTIVTMCAAENATNNSSVTFELRSPNSFSQPLASCSLGSGTGAPGSCALNWIATSASLSGATATSTSFYIRNSNTSNTATARCSAFTR